MSAQKVDGGNDEGGARSPLESGLFPVSASRTKFALWIASKFRVGAKFRAAHYSYVANVPRVTGTRRLPRFPPTSPSPAKGDKSKARLQVEILRGSVPTPGSVVRGGVAP